MNLPKIKRIPSFAYPLKGVYFFLAHPKELWLKTLSPIVLSIIFSTFSIGFSLKVLLPGHVEKLIEWHWPHWMSWFVSVISVVLESAIINLLFFAILVPIFQDAVFDATLEAKGLGHLLDDTEDIPRIVICWRNIRSSILVNWLLIMVKILLLILTSPFQLVPVVGTALACYISGWPTAWNQHLHYDIEIRGLKVSESYRYAKEHKWDYANFGSVAFALEILPVFNIFFVWTNIVGAGLWVAATYEHENDQTTEEEESVPYPPAKKPTTTTATEQTPLLQ